MKQVVLLLGSNIESRVLNLELALIALADKAGRVIMKSSIYESEAWGFESDSNFLNQVVIIETQHTPIIFLEYTQEIERKLERKKTKNGYESRTIDIDILFFDDLIYDSEELTIPHPRLHMRKFTLKPLCEILPDIIHPLFNKTCEKLLIECDDNLWVKKYSN